MGLGAIALNPTYNRAQVQRSTVIKPSSKNQISDLSFSGAVNSHRDCGVFEFHSMKDCDVDETMWGLGYAVAGTQGDDNQLPCNFYKPVEFDEEAQESKTDAEPSDSDEVQSVSDDSYAAIVPVPLPTAWK